MSQPYFQLTELDGALGSQPSGDPLLAFVGVSTAGPLNTPAAFARTKDVVSNFVGGPVVEAICFYIQVYKKPALIVRTAASIAATNGTIDITAKTGTTTPSITAATLADGNYDLYFKVVNGGTLGVTGITFTWSADAGRTPSAITALGTGLVFAFPNLGGISFTFTTATTLVVGDIVQLRTFAPNWNATDLAVALAALKLSTIAWDLVHVVGNQDATSYAALASSLAGMSEKTAIAHTRMPNIAESEAAYLAAMNTIFAPLANTQISLAYGAAVVTSGVNFRQYRMPFSTPYAALAASVSEEVDVSQIDVGLLTGVDIRDANGNPSEHDESANPGADDGRYVCARTWDGVQGVYVNNPNLHSPAGSDFTYLQHRRVMNLAKRSLRLYMQRRLSKPIVVDGKTGFILESQAKEIESGANAILRSVLLNKPKCSAGAFGPALFLKLSRTDNLLSTKTLTGQAGIVPLAYPKAILIDIGFRNPALSVITA